jgi:hypothetical protein
MTRDVLDRDEAAPGDDPLDVARVIDFLPYFLVTTLPVDHAQMPGERVLGIDVDHGLCERSHSQQIIGGRHAAVFE